MYDWHNGTKLDRSASGIHSQDLIEADLLNQLDENDGTPLFYYAAFHNTHSPMQVSSTSQQKIPSIALWFFFSRSLNMRHSTMIWTHPQLARNTSVSNSYSRLSPAM
jgi:hypothetical protein